MNELSDEPHNAFVKSFASRQAEKRKAFAELDAYLPDYKQRLLEQGLAQGLEQGIALAKRETVRAMAARHFDSTLIADVTGLSVDQIKAILAEQAA